MKLTPWRRAETALPALTDFPPGSLASWMQRFFDEDGWPAIPSRLPATFSGTSIPAVDLAESDKELTVAVELPGLEEEDIQVTLQGNLLTIRAERKFEEEKKDKRYHRVESQYGMFERTLTMPEGLKQDAIDARYKKGILTLTIPKVEPTPATTVRVKAG